MSDINFEDNKNRESSKFPCPACGAVMTFSPENGKLQCEYCKKVIDFEKIAGEIKEYDFFTLDETKIKKADLGESSLTIQCESCGAKTVVNDNTLSKFCAFCGSPRVLSREELGGIPPESVVPFEITQQYAKEAFKKWIKKRFFAPSALRKQTDFAGKLNGIYVPYWTYDSDTYYSYTAQAGTYYYVTKTRIVNGKTQTYQEQHIRWRNVAGNGRHYFDDLQIQATKDLDDTLLDKIEPFAMQKLTPYQNEYLAGFLAERYSIEVKDGWETAKKEIHSALIKMIEQSIAADVVRDIRIVTNYKTVLYKHLLLPVWLSAYKYKSKTYQYMINGENGKVAGKAPVSIPKVLFTIAIICAVAYGVYRLLLYLGVI